MTMYDADGTTDFADPRHALASSIERLQRRGLRPVVAAEIEFYLLATRCAGSARSGAGSAVRPHATHASTRYGLAQAARHGAAVR